MTAAVLLLLAAAPEARPHLLALERLVVVNERFEVPAKGWRDINLTLQQRPAIIDCRFAVTRGGSGVRVALMERAAVERLRAGLPHAAIASTGFERSGEFRFAPGKTGETAWCWTTRSRAAARRRSG